MSPQQLLAVLFARKGVIALGLLVTLATAVAVSALLPARWTASAAVLVDAKGPDPISGLLLPAQLLPGYMATQVDIIQSQNVALKVVDALKLDASPVARDEWQRDTGGRGSLRIWLADLLLKRLDVRPSRESSVINISFTASDPAFAAAVANAFARAYIGTHLELRVEPARQAAEWFGERTRALRQDVEQSTGKLAQYQRDKGIVSLDERLETGNARLDQLNLQLSQAAAQTADALSRQRLARDFAASGRPPDALPDVLASPLVASLKADLARLDGRVQELASRLGRGHPQLQAALAEADSVRQRLDDEIRTVLRGIDSNAQVAQRREAELRAQVAAQKDLVLRVKNERDELAALMREAENAQKAFDVTTQRFTQANLESQATQTNVAVLNPAVEPIEPSFPRWPLNLALATVLGTMLGVGLALLLELLDQRVRMASDLASRVGVPVLASLPRARLPRGPRPGLPWRRAPST
jgi:chain length determinant protein EpsF